MSRVIYTEKALADLQRLRDFLRPKNPSVAKRCAQAILTSLKSLTEQPQIGRLIEGLPESYRDWVIAFGDSGYVVRYRIEGEHIIVLALRPQKEVGF